MSTDTIEPTSQLAKANSERVQTLIDHFASLSEPGSGPGVTRLGYTPLERTAHTSFAHHMETLGLTVYADAAGNTIAELAGTEDLPAIGTGSHLDSVPNAGRFDGIAGVVAAMEVATLFTQGRARPRHPVRFVVFATEEGARFGQACTGSRLAAGLTTPADLDGLLDKDGISVADAMRKLGMDPAKTADAVWRSEDWAGFIELHVEQGSVLADIGLSIGIVDSISGSTRFKITMLGRASHTGGTPMHLRADALAASAEVVLAAEHLANDTRHRGTRITVGRLTVSPGSITTIPGECQLSVDVRDVDSQRQRESATELIALAHEVAAARGVGILVEILGDASPVVLPVRVRSVITDAATGLGLDYRVMPSGASHDTQMINHVTAGGMIFVPSQNFGISHAPEELTYAVDLARGADLLAASLLRFDRVVDAEGN